MPHKGKSTDEIMSSLREAEVRLGQSEMVGEDLRRLRQLSAGVVHVIRW
jgi:hypothetical protein